MLTEVLLTQPPLKCFMGYLRHSKKNVKFTRIIWNVKIHREHYQMSDKPQII